jgi:hypothetical protein
LLLKEDKMAKFVIAPHFRLQEWVAEEKGYFAAEGLDYEFRETMSSQSGATHHLGNQVGAYQTFEQGRTASSTVTPIRCRRPESSCRRTQPSRSPPI